MPLPPRLLYIGDVPVETTYHGSALLFRHLENYPVDRLMIIEGGMFESGTARRLCGVRYAKIVAGRARLLRTRFASWYSLWLSLTAAKRAGRIRYLLDGYKPEAVLTVAHGYSWLAAASYAKQHDLPLHLVVHDDWPEATPVPKHARAWLHRRFGQVYRLANSRLCVSPFMVEEYRHRYGATGTLLFPSRAANGPDFGAAVVSAHFGNQRPFTVAYAGSLNTADYISALQMVAKALLSIGGRLLVFGPIQEADLQRLGLSHSHIQFRGILPSADLLKRLRDEADALFVPMSFAPSDRLSMQLSFPSKLADYSTVGAPLLIRGPKEASAVRWAQEHPGVAHVVDAEDYASLLQAVRLLASDPTYRQRIGQNAMDIGRCCFSHDAVSAIFYGALKHQQDQASDGGRAEGLAP